MSVLFQIGLLQIEVAPFNFDESELEMGFDFAAKDIVGAPKPREKVGQADTMLRFRGKLYPHRLGGLTELQIAERMSTSGDPQMVVRGDGAVLGWFFVEKLRERSGYFNSVGVGREIEVDVELVKSPNAASASSMLSTIFGLFG